MKGDLWGGSWPVGSWPVNGHDSISRVFVIDFGATAGAVIPMSNLSFVRADSMFLSLLEVTRICCSGRLLQRVLPFCHFRFIGILLLTSLYLSMHIHFF